MSSYSAFLLMEMFLQSNGRTHARVPENERSEFLGFRGRPYGNVQKSYGSGELRSPEPKRCCIDLTHGCFATYTSSTADAASAVPLLTLEKADNVPMFRHVVCRDRRPRLSAPKRCYIGLTHGCFATYTSSTTFGGPPSPAGEG